MMSKMAAVLVWGASCHYGEGPWLETTAILLVVKQQMVGIEEIEGGCVWRKTRWDVLV